jgi:hypothetical protein
VQSQARNFLDLRGVETLVLHRVVRGIVSFRSVAVSSQGFFQLNLAQMSAFRKSVHVRVRVIGTHDPKP